MGGHTIDGNTGGGDGGSSLILGGEDVARAPCDLGTESCERLDENGRLDGHVQASCDARSLERLAGSILGTDGHKTGHLVLGHVDVLASSFGELDIS
jgi:hypothetical protein